MAVIIKGRLFSSDEPLICVPIMEESAAGVLSEAARLTAGGVPMIEWRIDVYSSWKDASEVRDILEKLRQITRNTILLATLRSREQGGLAEVDPYEKSLLYDEIAQAHCADIIDVEAESFPDAGNLIKQLQSRGACVLVSSHNFTETPSGEKLMEIFGYLSALDADIIKIAVMPSGDSDVARLMDAAGSFHSQNPEVPLIAVSMGDLGVRSRLEIRSFGGCVTFASGSKKSAPGQMPYERVREELFG